MVRFLEASNGMNSPSSPFVRRESNIELLRIVAMLAIVAHHSVVNSTVWELFNPVLPTANSVFLQLWGMWGKTAINVFVLITGYFMCKSRLTARRYLKMLFEILFYSYVMWLVLSVTGYDTLTWRAALRRPYTLLAKQDGGFISAFMWMYLLIPAFNVYLHGTTRQNLYATLAVLLGMFSVCGTFLDAKVYHHVFWYATLYLVGAAIRLHPFGWMKRGKTCMALLAVSMVAAWCSVIGLVWLSKWLGRPVRHPYFFVADSHKLLAFTTALFAFLVFKNWKLPQSRFVNAVASTTFGVLLIHAASDGMRKWLWQDFLDVPSAYSFSLPALIGYSAFVMVAVCAVCSMLDWLRILFVEKPMLRWIDTRNYKTF